MAKAVLLSNIHCSWSEISKNTATTISYMYFTLHVDEMKLKNHNANDNETAQADSFSHELVCRHIIFITLVL